MDLIVSLLVLGAVYSISYVMRSLSPKGGEEGGKPIFGEGFPTIEILGPEQEAEEKAEPSSSPVLGQEPRNSAFPVQPVATTVTRPSAATKQQRLNVDRSPQTQMPVQHVEESEPRRRLVSLGNKSEAKRAFIYSEIFNRKY